MLSLFPQILFLGPLGITLIRVAVGLMVVYIGYSLFEESSVVAREKFFIIGRCPAWLAKTGGVVQIVVGLFLVIGLWTQAAAILAGILALKCLIWGKRYEKIIPISRAASFLLLAISLCLLVSGAGSFAFDLPL